MTSEWFRCLEEQTEPVRCGSSHNYSGLYGPLPGNTSAIWRLTMTTNVLQLLAARGSAALLWHRYDPGIPEEHDYSRTACFGTSSLSAIGIAAVTLPVSQGLGLSG
jgi:hypothetical protein